MGILVNKSIGNQKPKIIPYEKKFSTGKHFALTEYPFLIGKLLTSTRSSDIEHFKSRQVEYTYRQLPGYNVIFIQAGFTNVPQRIVKEKEIESALDLMCIWYLENVLNNNKIVRSRLKIKP